jgi:hypothetical protein
MIDVLVPDNPRLAAALAAAGWQVSESPEDRDAARILVTPDGEPAAQTLVCAAAEPPWHLLAMLEGWAGPGLAAAYAAEQAGAPSPIILSAGPPARLAAMPPLAGQFYTLICTDPAIATAPLQAQAGIAGMPLTVLDVAAPMPDRLTLLRADGLIAWRGDGLPADLAGLVSVLRGGVPSA